MTSKSKSSLPPTSSKYGSTGFIPDPTNSTSAGFLDKYNNNKVNLQIHNGKSGKSFTPFQPTVSSTLNTMGSQHLTTTPSENPYECCFVIPPGLESCPALNFDDICDTCCAPQKPICSQDPNCHMFKECNGGTYSYGHTCKYLPARGPKIPSWLAFCGRVLVFYGFYQEPIPESDKETYRIRQVLIRFYMEDGTVDVFEPKTFDPGFTQGRLIRRHRIPLPAPADSEFYTIEHFNVGCEVEFYGKTFLICGCNDATRKYINKLGITVPPNVSVPDDPYTIWRKDRITSLFARKARIDLTQGKFKSFLLNNRKVLRFWAFWDDRCQEHGYLRKFIIHFFLEDDTIEIKEIPHNTASDVVPTFLNRAKLFKNYKDLNLSIPGNKDEALLILNTSGDNQNVFLGQSFLEDRLCPGVQDRPYIQDRDLAIGAVLNVYGRAFIITECDDFTKTYYHEKYGIQDFTPLTLTEEETRKDELPRMEPPPHIGIGDEADTLANWDRIDIHPPRKDELRLLVMEKDILGFDARFVKAQHKVNADRRFIINYYMADSTIKIFERPHPNTGMKQGTFLQRCRPRKSDAGMLPRYELGEVSEFYQPADFYVGNTLLVNGFQFLLTSADNLTHEYMEKNIHLFPQSNLCLIFDKVREALGPYRSSDLLALFSENDTCLQGVMDVNDFRDLLYKLVKCSLSEHEMTTLMRALQVKADEPGPNMDTLKSVIQTELSRMGFDRYYMQRVEYTLRYHDPCRTGVVDRQTLRSALLAARIPVQKQLIDFLIEKFEPADECNRVNYCKVMEFLDYVKHPAPKAKPTNIACVMKWLEPKPPSKIFCINYKAFLETVCPNFKCSLPETCCPPECNTENACANEVEQCDPGVEMCCPEVDERCLAGRVITDNHPWNEKDRCDSQDHCEFQMAYDPYSGNELMGPVSPYINSNLELAYQSPPVNDCESPEGGGRELLHCGDHIGFEDLYR